MNNTLDPFDREISEQTHKAVSQIISTIASNEELIASPLRIQESGDDFDSPQRYTSFTTIVSYILTALIEAGIPEFIQNYTYSTNVRDYLTRSLSQILAPGNPESMHVSGTDIEIEKYKGIIRFGFTSNGSTEEFFYEYSPTNLATALQKLKKIKFGAGSTGEARHSGPGNQV